LQHDESIISVTTTGVIVKGASSAFSITNDKTVSGIAVEPDAKLNFAAAKTLTVMGDLILNADETNTFSVNL
jgi:hypothetical protein